MIDERCAACRFLDPYDHDEGWHVIWGVCRRYPPILFTNNSGEELFIDELSDKWRQPNVRADDWCGEFQRLSIGAIAPEAGAK